MDCASRSATPATRKRTVAIARDKLPSSICTTMLNGIAHPAFVVPQQCSNGFVAMRLATSHREEERCVLDTLEQSLRLSAICIPCLFVSPLAPMLLMLHHINRENPIGPLFTAPRLSVLGGGYVRSQRKTQDLCCSLKNLRLTCEEDLGFLPRNVPAATHRNSGREVFRFRTSVVSNSGGKKPSKTSKELFVFCERDRPITPLSFILHTHTRVFSPFVLGLFLGLFLEVACLPTQQQLEGTFSSRFLCDSSSPPDCVVLSIWRRGAARNEKAQKPQKRRKKRRTSQRRERNASRKRRIR